MKGTLIKAEPTVIAITPYAMARTANDLFNMAREFDEGPKVSFARYYVFCASIEIGLKAAILAIDCNEKQKRMIKSLKHDLCKVQHRFEQYYGAIWECDEKLTIERINPFFRSKALEYFTIELLVATVSGLKELPEIDEIETAALRVNDFLHTKKLFVHL